MRPVKSRQRSIKVSQKWFHWEIKDFDIFTKIIWECGRLGQTTYLLPQALKCCPKSNKSPNLVILTMTLTQIGVLTTKQMMISWHLFEQCIKKRNTRWTKSVSIGPIYDEGKKWFLKCFSREWELERERKRERERGKRELKDRKSLNRKRERERVIDGNGERKSGTERQRSKMV